MSSFRIVRPDCDVFFTTGILLAQLLKAGKCEEAAKFLISAARRASGVERDHLLAQLATLYESTGDWRKVAGAWRKIAEEGDEEYREAATFDWIRTTAAIGRNADGVEAMWKKFLREFPASTYSHLAVTRLAELMISQKREAEAEALLDGWLKSAEGKSAAADFVSNLLAELRQQQEEEKGSARTAFAEERLEALAKLPAELDTLCDLARSGKGKGKILNRIRDIRRCMAGSEIAPSLLLRIDLTEAIAHNGLGDSRKALGLLDDAWSGISLPHDSKDTSHNKALADLSTEAIGIAVETGDHRAAVAWAERMA